jgi:hypothetical protein
MVTRTGIVIVTGTGVMTGMDAGMGIAGNRK